LADLDSQRFCTFPQTVDSLKIGLLGDLDKRLSIEAPAIARLADRQPDLLLLIGDWDHRDPISLDQLWQMHRENRDPRKLAARPMIDRFFNKVPIAYTWDDHDYGNNNSDRFSLLREDALRAYDDYWPANGRSEGQAGIWYEYRIGDLVEVFMLDTRSQRDPDTYLDPRFVPDRTEGSNRGALRDDPARSMLDGAAQPEGMSTGQKAWLKESLLTSPAVWKVVVSSVTWNGTTVKDDAWWDFRAERNELVSFIQTNNITGVIFVSADLHTGGGIDDGTNADFPEVTIPSANLNQDESGRSSCAIHPTPDRTLRTSCGDWSQGLFDHGSGYGLITLDRTHAIVETVNLLGGTVSLTIPQP
jgi:alkaline phosphatase D